MEKTLLFVGKLLTHLHGAERFFDHGGRYQMGEVFAVRFLLDFGNNSVEEFLRRNRPGRLAHLEHLDGALQVLVGLLPRAIENPIFAKKIFEGLKSRKNFIPLPIG